MYSPLRMLPYECYSPRNVFFLCLPFFLQERGRSRCNTDAKGQRHRSQVKQHHKEARCFVCTRRQLLPEQVENIAYYTYEGGEKMTKALNVL